MSHTEPDDRDMVEHHHFEVAEHKRILHDAVIRLEGARVLIEGICSVDPPTDAAVNVAQRRVLDALATLALMQHTAPTDQTPRSNQST